MNDVLLKMGGSRGARKLLKTLGMPVPLPVALERASGPWEQLPLSGRAILIGSAAASPSALALLVGQILKDAGAEVLPTSNVAGVGGLVFDATELSAPAELRVLFD